MFFKLSNLLPYLNSSSFADAFTHLSLILWKIILNKYLSLPMYQTAVKTWYYRHLNCLIICPKLIKTLKFPSYHYWSISLDYKFHPPCNLFAVWNLSLILTRVKQRLAAISIVCMMGNRQQSLVWSRGASKSFLSLFLRYFIVL